MPGLARSRRVLSSLDGSAEEDEEEKETEEERAEEEKEEEETGFVKAGQVCPSRVRS